MQAQTTTAPTRSLSQDLRFFATAIAIMLAGSYLYTHWPAPAPTPQVVQVAGDTSDLQAIQSALEKRLQGVRDGLPLTPKEMQRLGEIYHELLARGGKPEEIAALLELCRQIVEASGNMELHLETQQNGRQDGDTNLQGLAR